MDFNFWVEKLELLPHPEGGFFKETYRSDTLIPQSALPKSFKGSRNCSTGIYFLLTGENFSAFHKIASDELWHFYAGDGLTVQIIHPDGKHNSIKLGSDIENGEVFQACVPAESWFASQPTNKTGWALVGCTVSPGFDFEDFEMAKRDDLLAQFPEHRIIIKELTRS